MDLNAVLGKQDFKSEWAHGASDVFDVAMETVSHFDEIKSVRGVHVRFHDGGYEDDEEAWGALWGIRPSW